MLNRRGADGQNVRIPRDASRDVQATIQDIKDNLRTLEAKYLSTKTALSELEQRVADSGSETETSSFNEVREETVFQSPVGFSAGSAANPSIHFSDDPDTGVYLGGTNILSFSTAGAAAWNISAAGTLYPSNNSVLKIADGSYANPGLSFLNDPDTGFFRDSADELRVSVGGKRHTDFLEADASNHNTTVHYDNDYEGYLSTQMLNTGAAAYAYMFYTNAVKTSAHFYIRNNTATGYLRLGTAGLDKWVITNLGHLQPNADDAYNVGSSTAAVLHLYQKGIHVHKDGGETGVSGGNMAYTRYEEGTEDCLLISENTGAYVPVAHAISAGGWRNATQSIPNTTWTKLAFNTLLFETPSSTYCDFDGTNNRVNINRTGYYIIGWSVYFAANASGRRLVQIRKNGASIAQYEWAGSANPIIKGGTFTDTAAANTSTYYEVYVYQGSGGALNHQATNNHIVAIWQGS